MWRADRIKMEKTSFRSSIIVLFKPLSAKAGLVILVAILLLVFAGSFLDPYSPNAIVGRPYSPPSMAHPFGTDFIGHDLLSQVIWGAYPSMFVAFYVAMAGTLLGFFAGALAGYFRRLEEPLGGLTDVVLSLPTLPLLIIIGTILYSYPNLIPIFLILVLWAPVARAIRAQTLSVKKLAYVDAGRTSGLKNRHILTGIIFYEVAPIAMAYFIINISVSLILITALEFLGVGNPLVVSWGSIMYWAQQYAFGEDAWWWVIAPGMIISLFCTAFGLIGFSFEEMINPRLRT